MAEAQHDISPIERAFHGLSDDSAGGQLAPWERDLGEHLVSIEAEAMLLGGLLLGEPAAWWAAADKVGPDDFHDSLHGAVFAAIGEAVREGRTPSPLTIAPAVKGHPALAAIGQSAEQYLGTLMASAIGAAFSPDIAESVHALAEKRRVMWACVEAVETLRAGAGTDSLSEAAAKVTGAVQRALEGGAGTSAHTLDEAAGSALAALDRAEAPGVTTGLSALDRALGGGPKPGQLVLVAGRPGMGKTAAGLVFAMGAARAGRGVLFVSLEMAAGELAQRLLSAAAHDEGARIPYQDIDAGTVDPMDRAVLDRARNAMKGLPLVIDDGPSRSVTAIEAAIRAHQGRFLRDGKELGLVVIDQLNKIRHSGAYRGQRVFEVDEVANDLKTLAKRLGLPVVVLHQLNRQTENRDDKRPTLADLRDSGALEQEADTVLLLYRPAYYLERKEPPRNATNWAEWSDEVAGLRPKFEAIVAKRRQGRAPWTVHLAAEMEFNVIRDGDGA